VGELVHPTNATRIVSAYRGFADLAKLLGQNHQGSSRSIPADTLDTETFWTVALTTATAINQPPPA
jgi:hypothetical protein